MAAGEGAAVADVADATARELSDEDRATAGSASVGGADPAAGATDGGAEEIAERDPCAVLSAEEWQSWSAGGGGEDPVALEDSTVCGWKDGDDQRRIAIGVFEVAAEARWLGQDDEADGAPVAGLGDDATWLEGWPVPQSSTLVVEVGNLDVVIELSARDETTQSALRETAVRLAELALGRLA